MLRASDLTDTSERGRCATFEVSECIIAGSKLSKCDRLDERKTQEGRLSETERMQGVKMKDDGQWNECEEGNRDEVPNVSATESDQGE
jgi:hypothetical protein